MKKNIIIWSLAIVITLVSAYYQRVTGPTYPTGATLDFENGSYSFELPRSHGGEQDAEISVTIPDNSVRGKLSYRRFPTDDEWTEVNFVRKEDELSASMPHQPPAGKLEYFLTFSNQHEQIKIAEKTPIVIRFKGDVPIYILLPHVIFMFIALLVSNLAGILALAKDDRFRFYTILTLVLIFVGGMILGPIVQKYAFDDYWTGIPFGWDLTDNKTLIAFAAYIIAIAGNIKGRNRYLTIGAAIVMLLVFSIPHSILGSQLDYSSGVISQG